MKINKEIPLQMTTTQSKFFYIPRSMDDIMNDLFKGDAWAANHFQNDMVNNNQLIIVVVDGKLKFSKPI